MLPLRIMGNVDGSNRQFELHHVPNILMLWRNGKLQTADIDYTLVGNTLTMTTAPQLGDKLHAFDPMG